MKKPLLFLFLLTIGFAASAQTGYISNLPPSQFKTAMEGEKNKKLIDVRQDWEFAKGHLANAVNIDAMADDFEKKIGEIPRDTPLYIYCYSGGRSAEAAEKMKAMGFKKVVNMTGGISAWEKALLPVVK